MKEPGVEIIPAVPSSEFPVPAIIAAAGDKASEHFLEFFAATIRNKNTRAAYVQAAAQFCSWCEENGLRLGTIRPLHVSAYIETKPLTAPSIKQHLAALRGLFNWRASKHSRSDQQTLALVWKVNCHDRHDGGMSNIQPCGEDDHSAIR